MTTIDNQKVIDGLRAIAGKDGIPEIGQISMSEGPFVQFGLIKKDGWAVGIAWPCDVPGAPAIWKDGQTGDEPMRAVAQARTANGGATQTIRFAANTEEELVELAKGAIERLRPIALEYLARGPNADGSGVPVPLARLPLGDVAARISRAVEARGPAITIEKSTHDRQVFVRLRREGKAVEIRYPFTPPATVRPAEGAEYAAIRNCNATGSQTPFVYPSMPSNEGQAGDLLAAIACRMLA